MNDIPLNPLTFVLDIPLEKNSVSINALDKFLYKGSFFPRPKLISTTDSFIIVLGNPIRENKFLNEEDFLGLSASNVKGFVMSLNGQWALYFFDRQNLKLHAFTDRTASWPIFYRVSETNIVLSLSYYQIWRHYVKKEEIEKDNFYEFLCLRRLMGNKTFDKKTFFLENSSLIEVDFKSHKIRSEKYQNYDFEKFTDDPSKLSSDLSEIIYDSINNRLNDGAQHGLLLSGGLDSRVPLIVNNKKFHCFTSGYWKNNETRVAEKVASLGSNKIFYLKRPWNQYDKLFPDGVYLVDNMRDFHSASWALLAKQISEKNITSVFSGYAFDYLLGDNYLPRVQKKVLGRYPTFINKLEEKKTNESPTSYFLRTISWRYKTTKTRDLVTPKAWDRIYSSTEYQFLEASQFSDHLLDQYNYLTINNLSRHSMYIESSMLRLFVEDRVPGIDNHLFNFSLKIPFSMKMNYNLYKLALKNLDSIGYLDVENANTNYPCSYGPYSSTYLLFYNKVKELIGLPAKTPPSEEDRSWGANDFIYKKNPNLLEQLHQYKKFLIWDFLDELNKEHIENKIENHLDGSEVNHILMRHLIGIEEFLKLKL